MGARIKTEAEFISEYGANWHQRAGGSIDWNHEGNMDHLFGFRLSSDAADSIHRFGTWVMEGKVRNWTIYSNMVVFSPDSTLDMDRLSSWPPEEGHAKWWSGLASTTH